MGLGLVRPNPDPGPNLRLAREPWAEELQLIVDRLEVARRVLARAVDDMHEQPAALRVPQEGAAQPAALVRA